jgi:hypothetical protein
VSIRRDLRRVAARLRELKPCPRCGLAREEAAGMRGLDTRHQGVLAWRRCPECGSVSGLYFTLVIGPPLPRWERREAERFARELAAEGVSPADGWEMRPEITEAMARLDLDR